MQCIGIIGASLAGLHAAQTLRREGYAGRLVVVGEEPELPYDRPPLSKEILRGEWHPDRVDLVPDRWALGIEWQLGRKAVDLEAEKRSVGYHDGSREEFDGLVIATGASARPWIGRSMEGVHLLRTRADSLRLRDELAQRPAHVAIIGAGFLGQEVAASCRAVGLPVTLIAPERGPGECVVGSRVAQILADIHAQNGVNLRLGVAALEILGESRARGVRLSDGGTIEADVVIVAIGAIPNTSWLESSGLEIKRGVVCDSGGLAADRVVAAGDVAAWYDPQLAMPRQIEHWDNAIRQGALAARRLLGELTKSDRPVTEPLVPWFWSDQYGQKLQMAGHGQSTDSVAVFRSPDSARRVVALFRRGNNLIAALGINAGRQIAHYRRSLTQNPGWDQAYADLQLHAFEEV